MDLSQPFKNPEQPRAEMQSQTLRLKIWQFLASDPESEPCLRIMSVAYESICFGLVLLVFSLGVIEPEGANTNLSLENLLAVILCIEYLLKVYACVEDQNLQKWAYEQGGCWSCWNCLGLSATMRLGKVFEIRMLLDLVVVSSVVADDEELDGVAALRVLRLVRIGTLLRLQRRYQFLDFIMQVMQQRSAELGATFGMSILLLLTAASAMYYIEAPDNDMFDDFGDALWWATTALTTVGYGDVYPTSAYGRVLGSMVAFVGVGMFALPAGILASGFQEVVEERKEIQRAQSFSLDPSLKDRVEDLHTEIQKLHEEQHRAATERQQILHLLRELVPVVVQAKDTLQPGAS